MTVEIISWSISTKVWDRTGIEIETPGSAVRHASVARHVTDCATRPGRNQMCEAQTTTPTPMPMESWSLCVDQALQAIQKIIIFGNLTVKVLKFIVIIYLVLNLMLHYSTYIDLVLYTCKSHQHIFGFYLKQNFDIQVYFGKCMHLFREVYCPIYCWKFVLRRLLIRQYT